MYFNFSNLLSCLSPQLGASPIHPFDCASILTILPPISSTETVIGLLQDFLGTVFQTVSPQAPSKFHQPTPRPRCSPPLPLRLCPRPPGFPLSPRRPLLFFASDDFDLSLLTHLHRRRTSDLQLWMCTVFGTSWIVGSSLRITVITFTSTSVDRTSSISSVLCTSICLCAPKGVSPTLSIH